MDFDSLVRKRKSVRAYSKKRVNWKSAMDAIDAALQGPFAGNYMNLKFLIIEDPKTINQLAVFSEQDWVADSPLLIAVFSDETHVENMYGERGRVYSRQQAGAAIQTIMFKLAEENIGSCWVGAYSDDSVRELLKVPPHLQIEAIISTGYEDKKKVETKKEKRSLDSSIFWEKWGQFRRQGLFEENQTEDYRPADNSA